MWHGRRIIERFEGKVEGWRTQSYGRVGIASLVIKKGKRIVHMESTRNIVTMLVSKALAEASERTGSRLWKSCVFIPVVSVCMARRLNV